MKQPGPGHTGKLAPTSPGRVGTSPFREQGVQEAGVSLGMGLRLGGCNTPSPHPRLGPSGGHSGRQEGPAAGAPIPGFHPETREALLWGRSDPPQLCPDSGQLLPEPVSRGPWSGQGGWERESSGDRGVGA